MRHKISNNKLSRKSSSRKALLRGLVTDTIKHGKIKTTKAKAKEAKPILEKLITIGKSKDYNSIRKVSEFIFEKSVVKQLFDDISTKYSDKQGGYSRIVSLGQRKGDNADIVILELID